MSTVSGLSICMARGNNCTVGNENNLLGLLVGGWGGDSKKIVGL
jgi:hypothetical protein